ncbi:tetratricopeptide repeat protein [Pyxidicoccus fallax]|uniref:Tetratricopeptide repeat protein n=1 Tax=Pyxidicoccus fallax TaxID=394095 RepID=A0A848LVL1_9BACT|nr:tetratricopeptide repeat protein [Pyxidicoccus fallax]NMO21836.1 tetratricopeptide repeat protein [Pyxidicoccus fallax]NPC83285.1 tetratricopeptide repeat protein [Pyxidicoccus fallax]
MRTSLCLRGMWGTLLAVPVMVWAQWAQLMAPPPGTPSQPPPAAPTPSVAAPAALPESAKEGIRLAQQHCPSDGFDKEGCDKAIRLLQEVARTDPDNADVQLALAQAYWNSSYRESPQARTRGELRQRALGIYQKLVDRDVKDARPYWELSLRQKNETQRLPLLKRTVALNPKHPQANKDLAQAELAEGNVDAAVSSYQKHLEVSPYRDSQDAMDHLAFAKRLEGVGRPDAAERVAERVSGLVEGERRATRCEIWRSVDPKLYQGNTQVAQRVRALLPYCTRTEDLERAAELERQGRVDEAIEAAKRQVAENPKPEGSYVLLERLYQRKGQSAQAAEVAVRQLEEDGDAHERCERFRTLAPATVRAMSKERVRALRRACRMPE